MNVQRKSGQMLTHPGSHQSCFSRMNREPLVRNDRGYMAAKPVCHPRELRTTGKGEVIRIACVGDVCCSRERSEAAVQPKRTKIGERRRCRRTLRKVWSSVEYASTLKLRRAQLASRV